MATQTSDLPAPAREGIETGPGPRSVTLKQERPEANTDAGRSSCSSSESIFEGIGAEEVKIMMELMRRLVSAHEILLGRDTFPRETIRSRTRTWKVQADLAESDFERLGAVGCIEKAVMCRSQLLSLTPNGHAAKPDRLHTLGISLLNRFRCLGELEDINKAIECKSQAMLRIPDGHPYKLHVQTNLGIAYQYRFNQLGDRVDRDKAIDNLSQVILTTPNRFSSNPAIHNSLGTLCHSRFDRFGDLADLNKAVKCCSQAVLLTPDGHPDKPEWHGNLGMSYQSRFERLDDLADLDKAIECKKQAVLLTPDGHPSKPRMYSYLGGAYQSRFERLGNLVDLDKAMECGSQAVLLIPDGDPYGQHVHNNLGVSYQTRFERLGDLADLEKGIKCVSQAALLIPDVHPDKPACHNNLGTLYQCRFQRLGDPADLDKAIEYLSEAVLLTPAGHPDKPSRQNNLGNSYEFRFHRLGDLADLNKAIDCLSQAVLLTPEGHPDKPGWHNNLGNAYQSRFKRLGDLADLDKAIKCKSQAVLLTPNGHPEKLGRHNNLGSAYQSRFERLGNLADIDKAIECQSQAVLLTPDDHPDKPGRRINLGISYLSRFERLGDFEDLDKAIECQSQAVLLIPDGHSDKPACYNSLGTAYRSRFGRLGHLADLNKAIECFSNAALLTPDGHRYKPTSHNNLGASYQLRFKQLGNLADLDKAIAYLSQAMLLIPDDHPDKHWQSNLGIAYQARFRQLGDLSDSDKAIDCFSRGVLLTPDSHPHKPVMHSNLGNSYQSRFEFTGTISDLKYAHSHFQRGALLQVLAPASQIACARKWAKSSSLLGLSPQPAYERCMELVPHLIWLGTTIDQRYTLMARITDLATEAAAWAISVQSYDLAIEWLEEGRSIVWNQILQLRTPFDDLAAINPDLAQRLKDIAAELDSASLRRGGELKVSVTNVPSDLETEAQHHRRLAAEWERSLEEARTLPGFQHFMSPRKASELKIAATDGPVILINTHSTRWDALLVFPRRDHIAHVPLVQSDVNEVGKSLESFLGSVAVYRGGTARGFAKHKPKSENPFKAMLTALWSLVVKPILDALSCKCKLPVKELLHVTWCATGPLAFLPLHAAGPHDGSSPNAFDLVVSSYAPSLSALLGSYVQEAHPADRILVVGQEYTEGHCPLPYTVYEIEAIKQHARTTCFLQLDGERATANAVLKAMGEHSWVHLACHATQNQDNPARSAFHLHNGNLTLEAIARRRFKNKGLAFLSACQTAKGDRKLPDESVHLAAGMLMAGYPSVIATMWSIADEDGPEVAGRVYAELLKDGKMNHKGAARALHKAVSKLREKVGVDLFERWVPFIHIGV